MALVAAFLSFFVGVGPILFRRNAIFLIVGVAMALDFWVLGQAFGQVFTGMATDPDTGPLLVLLALAVYRAGVPAGAPAEMRALEPSSPVRDGGGITLRRTASCGRASERPRKVITSTISWRSSEPRRARPTRR